MGSSFTAKDVEDVCSAIDRIPLEDLGLDPARAAAATAAAATAALADAAADAAGGPAARLLRARAAQQAAARAQGPRAITYLHIHEDPRVTIGIFQLPAGARIPLHNHPGMTVFSRLLFGCLHIRAYDWADGGGDGGGDGDGMAVPAAGGGGYGGPLHGVRRSCDMELDDGCSPLHRGDDGRPHGHHHDQQQQQQHAAGKAAAAAGRRASGGGGALPPIGRQHSEDGGDSSCSNASTISTLSCGPAASGAFGGVRAARLVADRVLSAPTPTSVLFPADGGNIHCFTAITPCAVLDVLTPPYAPAAGRDCTYYREAFPPALVDDCGRPLLVPADDVAAWVRWQAAGAAAPAPVSFSPPAPAAGRRGGGRQFEDDGLGPMEEEEGEDEEGTGMYGGGGGEGVAGGAGAGGAGFGAPPPWSLFGGEQQQHGAVVGLEATAMPPDFAVDRGVYQGKTVGGP